MALSPTNDAALLQEVDEAVRKDEMMAFMNRYGRWLALALVAALLAFGGYLFWQHRQTEARGLQAEQFSAAIDKVGAGQLAEADKQLKAISADAGPAYRSAARIEQANILARSGKNKEAAAMLAAVASDTKVDGGLRDLALIRQTALELDTLKPEAVIARLTPIVSAKDPQSAWFASAAELTAIAHYQLGQMDKAGALFGQIVKTPDLAPSLKSRAVQMAGMLGVDAVVDGADQKAAAAQNAGDATKTESSN
ncbi:tetratricopeptide repeat protein [Sphingopyxis yananensis]|uniref:tetratricopeptide repeat protein n=1 Tax=Sphingopyxis yananensis TaxID=2886687 RepID=UPI001D125C9B|nr:tetratricopeptide repeat protein [Sphingopyxis yananensis]MCC2601773.1 tetratricopeptide repeat protein [Sphingopyxis yananensis]